MAGTTNSTNLTQFNLPQILATEITLALAQEIVIMPYVHLENAVNSTTVKFPINTAVTAASYTEDTGMPLTVYSENSANVTVAPVGITFRVSNFLKELDNPYTNLPQLLIEEGTRSVARAVDSALGTLFTGFSQGINDAGNAIDISHWIAGGALLDENNVPRDNRTGIVSPIQYQQLLGSIQTSGSVMYAFADTTKTGVIGDLFGVNCVRTNYVPEDTSGADWVGLMFRRPAIGLATMSGVGVNVDRAPAQFDAWDIAITKYFGVGIVQDLSAVRLVSRLAA